MFLVSLVHHYHPALVHRQALIQDRLLTPLTLILNLPFLKVFPSIAIYPLLRLICWNFTTQCLAVNGSSIGDCSRLSHTSWLLGAL